ncbi:6-phosphofructokinase [Sinanaerobacter chloroacetimidivorans]|jgi:6-phosphofructokinase|uniref:Pyrophosphate--fructose 6-phosphate 1-phosphotransferase n=1 Tax=Sinanaerobacter chloroacetimidivorans TaxID=2818044 RepID=A0A8J7W495_9FIRM|nr:6-phosphofructokinase [Sinanaerobacter chloroacetimidivorans]MBR0600599.1 6-phosphofructokinase [Sinanaerobacter chloroacetimidivorans]
MTKLKGACLIGQSGGPTSVINASALGCIEAALQSESVTRVYGAANGIKGVLDERIYDMNQEDPKELSLMKYTPSSVLGTCRYKLKDFKVDDTDYQRILEIFKKYDIRFFFYNGGNDSMDTCNKISSFLSQHDYDCKVIGIPKTIDNDLAATDHCPGYGSAAKYVATTCMEVYRDAKVYGTGSITVIEVMGRNAGWLTAASALAGYKDMGPDLIYLPEVPFDMDKFIADITKVYNEKGDVLVAVSEGIVDKDGKYISTYFTETAKSTDAFGHAQMGGLASNLANFANTKLNAKVRGIEFGLIQRCAAHVASATDIEEAYMAGFAAFKAAEEGITDKMVAFEREAGPVYSCKTKLVDLSDVANFEKKVPREWINEEGNGMKQEFIDYALPLIQGESEVPKEDGLPRFANLKKVLTTAK